MLHASTRLVLNRLAGFRVDALGPVQLADELGRPEELAVVAVERVGETVAICLEVEMLPDWPMRVPGRVRPRR